MYCLRIGALLIVPAFLLAACGGGGGDSADDTTSISRATTLSYTGLKSTSVPSRPALVVHPWQTVRVEPTFSSTAVAAADKSFSFGQAAAGLTIDAKTGVITGVPAMDVTGLRVDVAAAGYTGTLSQEIDLRIGALFPNYLDAAGGFAEVGDASGPGGTTPQVVNARVGQSGAISFAPYWVKHDVDAAGATVVTPGADLPAFTVVSFQVDTAPEGMVITPIASPKGTQGRITFTPLSAGEYAVRITMRMTNNGITRTLYPALTIQAQ